MNRRIVYPRRLVLRTLRLVDESGAWLGLLSLRMLLAWDFVESGLEKYRGENWFGEIRDRFPFPFDLLPPEWSWQMATGLELIGGIAILLGLATRFFSAALIVLTFVAIYSVHWPAEWHDWAGLYQGYGFTDRGYGNFKLPVLFIGMFLPLVFLGPGRLSLDAVLRRRWLAREPSLG